MEEDFYASIKLKTGEEIFARVLPYEDDGDMRLIVTNPVVFTEVQSRNGMTGYKVDPWMKTTHDDMFIIDMSDIITMTENENSEIINIHQNFVKKFNNIKNKKTNVTRKMGYIGSVSEAKDLLEKIFKNL